MKDLKNNSMLKKNIYINSEIYRDKIHRLIPGGAHTYTKGDDQFPELAPAAIAYGKGAWVWDIDGNKFLDCSLGLTSVTLGHAFEPVINRVKEELDRGVNFKRPSVIEKEMAEEFLSLVPQHDMIKFAKNGSIVTTAAVKLARAHTGRKLVAFPGDHPFYSYDDWFIGKTACNKGVPEEISALSVTFKSGDLKSLEQLFIDYPNQIACVITEPEKNFDKENGINPDEYIQSAIDLAHKNGALFILDEMITGFKMDIPGAIKKYKVAPDMATWGKSTANGFSFCALTGKREVMELGGIKKTGQEKVFLVSTTHGGETHSIAAGLATIRFYKQNDVISKNNQTGRLIIDKCNEIISNYNLQDFIAVSDTTWMPAFLFKNNDRVPDTGLRTLFMQEMIKNNVLFQSVFVPCYSHTGAELECFYLAFEESCKIYRVAIEQGFAKYLIGESAKPVFRKFL
jgi:glutamate-1-semialdehyde 2,1-aminomutase